MEHVAHAPARRNTSNSNTARSGNSRVPIQSDQFRAIIPAIAISERANVEIQARRDGSQVLYRLRNNAVQDRAMLPCGTGAIFYAGQLDQLIADLTQLRAAG